jgi:hypothetical protein
MLALEAAEKWFKSLDKGYFIKAYNNSSRVLKNKLTREGWEKTFLYKKLMFGKKIRRIKSQDVLSKNLKSYPPGYYTKIEYQTQYQKRGLSREQLVLVYEEGAWRVCDHKIY